MTELEERPAPDCIHGALHPRETQVLIGQDAAESSFLDAFNSGRLHHGWLLTGPRGVGKATLAWRLARFLLTIPKNDGGGLFADTPSTPSTLDVNSDHPVARRVAALSEPRLFLLRRGWDDKVDRLKTVISVDDVRKLRGFFSLSAADGGRRVVIIDSADEMNNAAANALLKVLEEPPADTVLILISHQPSALLPTIRSRCRTLRLNPLSAPDLQRALAQQPSVGTISPQALVELAGGSVGQAISLSSQRGVETYAELIALFGTLPGLDRPALLKLADSVSGKTAQVHFATLMNMIDLLLARLALSGTTGQFANDAVPSESDLFRRLAPSPTAARAWADLQQELSRRARQGAAVNLDPATLILDMGFKIDQTASKWAAR